MKLTKRLISVFLVCLISIVIASSVGGYLIRHQQVATSLQSILKAHYWQLTIWRYTIFALVIWYWPTAIQWLGKLKQWSAEDMDYFTKQRLRLAVFFILFELLIVHNGFSYILNALF
jgi:type III secretory pathway component EscS